MSGGVCLPPKVVDAFKSALTSGKIIPEKLAAMTSDERHALFKDIVGEGNAKFVNSTFEAKTLLKNQQRGYISWAKKLVGVTPEIRRDLISRIQKMDKVLNPAEEKMFLKDLASTKLGIDVTAKEAKQITNMSSKVQEYAAKQKPDGTFPTETDRMNYGYAKVDMGSYLSDLKNQAGKLSLKDQAISHPFQSISKLSGLSKSLKATLDNSALLHQGLATLLTNPGIWQKNARQSFVDIARELGNKNVIREIKADIVSRPNFDKYQKMGLDVGNVEEEFPTALPEKIPLLGRAYKASETAFTGFLYRQRADIADKLLQIADKSGVNIKDKAELQPIGKMVNALTGRGYLGSFEKAGRTLNNVFFSLRFLKSNLDILTAHQLQKGVTPFVRKQAAVNLVKVISGTAAILTIANAVKPGSVDFDPRSKDFGKIKVGNTRFDVTGGKAAIVVLAAQLIKQQTKSGTTGIISKLNSGFGSQTGVDVVNNFFENKLSPAASLVKDLIKQQDSNGNKPTLKSEAANTLLPFPVTTFTGTKGDPHGANALLTTLADGLGLSSNTYGATNKNVTLNQTPTSKAFQAKVGDAKFQQATQEYNTKMDSWMAAHKADLNKLPSDKQSSTLTSVKNKIQSIIYKQYGFKPPKSKPNPAAKSLLQSVK